MITVSRGMTTRNWSAIPAPAVAARKITTFACGGGDASSHLSEPVICQLRASHCHAEWRALGQWGRAAGTVCGRPGPSSWQLGGVSEVRESVVGLPLPGIVSVISWYSGCGQRDLPAGRYCAVGEHAARLSLHHILSAASVDER